MENKNGSYDLEGVIWHQHSNKLMVKILELWPDKSTPVIDLGCGHNFYANILEYAGYNACGIDNVSLRGIQIKADITKPLNLVTAGHNVISLEVGEHIPADISNGYLNNLTSFGGDIIMSWAIPGQAGVGHINCQSNEWVIEQMNLRGYSLHWDKSKELREAVNGCHCSWFQNTLMYFKPQNNG